MARHSERKWRATMHSTATYVVFDLDDVAKHHNVISTVVARGCWGTSTTSRHRHNVRFPATRSLWQLNFFTLLRFRTTQLGRFGCGAPNWTRVQYLNQTSTNYLVQVLNHLSLVWSQTWFSFIGFFAHPYLKLINHTKNDIKQKNFLVQCHFLKVQSL